jgi:hypothetical protein
MFCTKCGTQFHENDVICNNCGTGKAPATVPNPTTQTSATLHTVNTTQIQRKRVFVVLMSLFAATVLLVIIITFVTFIGGGGGNTCVVEGCNNTRFIGSATNPRSDLCNAHNNVACATPGCMLRREPMRTHCSNHINRR